MSDPFQRQIFLTVEEAAARIRVKPGTLYNWVHKGIIPYRKHGGKVILVWAELERWSLQQAKGLLQQASADDMIKSESNLKRSLKIKSKFRKKKKIKRIVTDDPDTTSELSEVDHE